MKNYRFILAAMIGLMVSACQKESLDITTDPHQPIYFANFLLLQDIEQGTCVDGQGFCLTARPETDTTQLTLGIDELLARPRLASDGRLMFEATTSTDRLSPEATRLLLEKPRIVIEAGFYVDENIIAQAYADAGMEVPSRRILIAPGPYDISREQTTDANGQLLKVEFTICGEEWCLIITIDI